MTQQTQPKLKSVQALRGIAALLVLFYHIGEQMIHSARLQGGGGAELLTDKWLFLGPWRQGYAGVDLFFVISGFIMVFVTYNSGRSVKDIGQFVYKRVVRIYPLWWVFVTIFAGYFFVTYGIWASPDLKGGTEPNFAYFLRSLLLVPQDSKPVLRLGWSLIHEMQFYLIFAIILLLPRRFMLPALGGWAAVNVMGFLLSWQSWGPAASIVFSVLSLEFIIGACAGWCVKQRIYKFAQPIFIFGVISSVLVVLFYTDQSRTMVAWGRVAVYSLPFAALIYGVAGLEQQNKLTSPPWLVHIGDWSYSLYLSHYLVLIGIIRIAREAKPYLPQNIVENLSLGAPGLWDNIAFALAAIILSIIAAALSYYIVEGPILKLARSKRPIQ